MKRKKKQLKRFAKALLLVLATITLFFAFRPEGQFVAADSEFTPQAASTLEVKLLTWNVRRGEEGDPLGAKWEKRKLSFAEILADSDYDIICLQEVLPEQLAFFKSLLPDYACISTGRKDGKSKGEHCSVFFDKQRFTLTRSDTFWLSPTPDKPSKGWGGLVPRICTWVQLEDKLTTSQFRVYNTHMQISPYAQYKAAQLLTEHFAEINLPLILAGDLNCPPGWPAGEVLTQEGFTPADKNAAMTFHIAGKGIRCLDHIFTDKNWAVTDGTIVKKKINNTYPSDHFGLSATLQLKPSRP